MKNIELSETYVGRGGTMMERRNRGAEHYFMFKGEMIPWDVAMDPKKREEWLASEEKKELTKAQQLFAEILKEEAERKRLEEDEWEAKVRESVRPDWFWAICFIAVFVITFKALGLW